MRCFRPLLLSGFLFLPPAAAAAEECRPEALGTARVLEVPFSQGPVGRASYGRTLPLARGEVVLTFDDGPMPRRTAAVLDALKAECVKATFFVVGTMVAQFPDTLRRTAAEGHTIATHTWSHRYLDRVRSQAVHREQINAGLQAARTVLDESDPALSPFFRFPGLGHTAALDRTAAAQRLMPFSVDVDGDDWKRITPAEVLERVLKRLDAAGRGIILLHDIQPRTVAILPDLLRALKARNYRVVHVVPAQADTQAALAALDTPQAGPIRLALDRLGTRMEAVRMAARAPDGTAAPGPVARAGQPSRVVVASEEGPLRLRAGLFEEEAEVRPAARPAVPAPRARSEPLPNPGRAVRVALVADAPGPSETGSVPREAGRGPITMHGAVPGFGPAHRAGWSGFVVIGAAPAAGGFRPVAEAGSPPR
ncbi:polysaccharide deacetylase family protein [Methylobacterium nonmethylotrophicum]|uniref:Chitooligosaccharide deacetylase n=1 Tax=Methylobacterium nonmethylotrophicum TaxID=1141884 RepID=A0A4Z0NLY1_9HYPH|nr:polysaccharide deacetylase family protein [Methylobacterium nonmethylotrophicum]TGD96768.1 polysaccharide deacetylase family protein [Methylobacterium nonmethylotrophicum]